MGLNMNMDFNKKSLIQIVLLVALVVIGAVGYLMQKEDGLGFITGFLESEPEPASPPIIRPKTPAPTEKMAEATIPEIPQRPATGTMRGNPFVVEASTIENGVLTLRGAANENLNVEVKMMLLLPPWEVPAGKKFNLSDAGGADSPNIVLAWKEKGQSAPTEQKFDDKYMLALELGQEKNKKLPGKVYLRLPDETKSQVAGTFEADIRGFHIIDGKPDLTVDAVDTLQYLALRDLLKDDAKNNIQVLAFRDGRYAQPDSSGRKITGYLEVEYRTMPDSSTIQRYQFSKEDGAWKIVGTLSGNQLDEAHPLHVPGPKSSPSELLTYLAAKRLESDIKKKSPKQVIYEPGFVTRHSNKLKIGVCEASYKLDMNGETVKTSYLFRLRKGGWSLDRKLGKQEKVDFNTGRIAKR